MKLEFTDQRMLLASVNARSEVHGEQREPAGDVGLEANLPNDVLSLFDSGLKGLLYHFDNARPKDLADQGKAHEKGHLPHLRFAKLAGPLKWDEEVTDLRVTIRVPGNSKEIILEPAKVNKFAFVPMDGGTVALSLRVQAHPDEKAFGKLSVLVQQDVEVTVTPAEKAA